MKTIILTLSVCAILMFSCISNAQKSKSLYHDEEVKQLVINYGNAMNSMAKSTLEFGSDTETEWAIDTVNAIWSECQKQPFDVLQYLSDIAVMERYVAYGVNYAPMMWYLSKHFQEYQSGQITYHTIFEYDMYKVDSLRKVIRESNDWNDYFMLHTYSLNLLDLYFVVHDDLYDNLDESDFASFRNLDANIAIHKKNIPNYEYYQWCIDGVSFFKTYTQWIRRTSNNLDTPSQTLLNWAYYMDDNSEPIYSALRDKSALPEITNEEHLEALKKTLSMYIEFLGMLEQNFKAIASEG